ncbi:MAG: ATP-binding protein [Vicinamibacterales bacterium]
MDTRLRELLLLFSRSLSASLTLPAALEAVTPAIRRALGARSVEIWLHERRVRELSLVASIGPRPPKTRISIEDRSHPAAWGLRLDRPTRRGAHLAAPLRGWRRALGTLVVERRATPARGRARRAFSGERDVIAFFHELARQLSVGIENVQLLDDILRQRRLLEDTFNSLVDLVAVVDRDLRVVQTNDAFAARVGYRRADVVRRPLGELVGAETVAFVEAADTWQGVLPATARRVDDPELDGTFLLTATPLVTDDGQSVGRVLVARDITRQARLEAERAALQERLSQSEKLASLGQFVAGIAHEMNNPLQGVLGHLELLQMNDAARPVRRDLKQIYQEADRAAKIVQHLLAFTGSRRLVRRRTDVDRVLTRAMASQALRLTQQKITIVRHQGKRLPAVAADALLLQQAFLNVLINAEHAVIAGGRSRTITISTASPRPGRRVIVTIRDSGPGIAADVLPRIFDPFFTTKEVGQGTGLGLAITYGIIQDHGGTISAANGRTGGAVFRIALPTAEVGDRVRADFPAA